MSRLIDVDAMIKKMTKELKSEKFDKGTVAMANCFIKILNEQPTANIDKDVREDAYNKGLEDGKEVLHKVYDMKCDEIQKVFGVTGGFYAVIYHFSMQDIIAKLEAYEKEQNEIKAGYVYEIMGKFCVVVQVDEFNNEYHIIWCDGGTDKIPFDTPIGFKKTGKHIDIQSILQQIGGEQGES